MLSNCGTTFTLISQILEDIILRVACQAKYEAQDSGFYYEMQNGRYIRNPGNPYRLQPLAALATLSRVCRTFTATIKGSPKLQHVLAGDPANSIPSTLSSPVTLQLKWLFEHAFGKALGRDYPGNSIRFYQTTGRCRRYLKTFSRSFGKFPEASWRKSRAHPEHVVESLEVEVWFRRPNGYKGGSNYYEKVDHGNGIVLEDLLERLASILCRTGLEHVAAMEKLATN